MMRIAKILAFSLVLCSSVALAEDAVAPSQASTTETELKQELAVRDSIMQVQDKEKSYNTVKKDNETCARMLSTSIEVNEKKKEKEDEEHRNAAMMTSSSFLGGIGIGLLIMWLIMK